MEPQPHSPGSASPASASPLSAEEVNRLDASLLPALERHHLRLLAHGLHTLQAVAGPQASGALPDRAALEAWARQQPMLQADPAFAASFCDQLGVLASQLEAIARPLQQPPLSLELEQLIQWAEAQAQERLQRQP